MAVTDMSSPLGRRLGIFSVVAPQDGGWSLSPMETLVSGVRGDTDVLAFELVGVDGVVSYGVRCNNPDTVQGMFTSYFPQARVGRTVRSYGDDIDSNDWLFLDEDERAVVQTLYLERESYLPLRIFDDPAIDRMKKDPLAGVIGLLATNTRPVGIGDGSDRLGLRLLVRPAAEDWGIQWQRKMQRRRDGEDRAARPGSTEASGPKTSVLAIGGGFLGMVLGNYFLWDSGNLPLAIPFNIAGLGAAFLGSYLWRRFGNADGPRPYMDEQLVEDKLKSLSYHAELQVVRIYRHVADEALALDSVRNVVNTLKFFDDPAGNAWEAGKLRQYSGELIFQGSSKHPFSGGQQELEYLEPLAARRCVLSAREVASVWHPPLGTDEMASMDRTAAGVRLPYLRELAGEGEDSGPLVGVAGSEGLEIRLPESALRKHGLIIGKSGTGKSTIIKHILAHKFERKAAGLDPGAVVVIDPHADLVREALTMVPSSIVDKVRLLDFGRMDRVPGINLVDPMLFPERDRCVDTIVNTVRNLWEHWGGRLEDLLKRSLSIVYEFNSNPETPRSEMMTILDILLLLDDGETSGKGPGAKTEMSNFQRKVLSRVSDPRLVQWFHQYLRWPPDTRAEAVGPVHSRVGAYAQDARASVILGQRESTVHLSDVLSEGLILLVSTASGAIGKQPAALMGGTMVSLVDAAMRAQEGLSRAERSDCLLVCDEFQTVSGADWEGMLAENRKYGGSLLLATQSVARLDTGERRLKAGVLSNIGVMMAFNLSGEDARIIAPEMDGRRVEDADLVNLDPHNCFARITSDKKVFPAFSLKTLPPPDVTHGSPESVEAILEASRVYTLPYEEVRDRLNKEVNMQLAMSNMKLGEKEGADSSVYSTLGKGKGGQGKPSPSAMEDFVSQVRASLPEDALSAAPVSAAASPAAEPAPEPSPAPSASVPVPAPKIGGSVAPSAPGPVPAAEGGGSPAASAVAPASVARNGDSPATSCAPVQASPSPAGRREPPAGPLPSPTPIVVVSEDVPGSGPPVEEEEPVAAALVTAHAGPGAAGGGYGSILRGRQPPSSSGPVGVPVSAKPAASVANGLDVDSLFDGLGPDSECITELAKRVTGANGGLSPVPSPEPAAGSGVAVQEQVLAPAAVAPAESASPAYASALDVVQRRMASSAAESSAVAVAEADPSAGPVLDEPVVVPDLGDSDEEGAVPYGNGPSFGVLDDAGASGGVFDPVDGGGVASTFSALDDDSLDEGDLEIVDSPSEGGEDVTPPGGVRFPNPSVKAKDSLRRVPQHLVDSSAFDEGLLGAFMRLIDRDPGLRYIADFRIADLVDREKRRVQREEREAIRAEVSDEYASFATTVVQAAEERGRKAGEAKARQDLAMEVSAVEDGPVDLERQRSSNSKAYTRRRV